MNEINRILTKAQQDIKNLTGETFYFVPATRPEQQYSAEQTYNQRELMQIALQIVANHFKVHSTHIIQPDKNKGSRNRQYVECREMLMKLCRENIIPQPSAKSIGIFIGNRDHATVFNGIQKVNDLIQTERGMAASYEFVERKFREYFTQKEYSKSVDKLNGNAVKSIV